MKTSINMLAYWLSVLAASVVSASPQSTHGEGEEGKTMGPVAFLWPPDRPWDAKDDNIPPCGSASGPGNRTIFPLSQGSIALSIADDAWQVAFRLAVSENPTKQSDFDDQVVSNITDVDPGHQCYRLDKVEGIAAGTNATIQMEYWAEFEGENNGNNQSFFACVDVTFVETKDFTIQVPCFNVTSSNFTAPAASSTSALPSSTGLSDTHATSSNAGLSSGAKAGIAVGALIGGLLLFGAIGFWFWRRGKASGLQGKEEYELRAKNLTTPEGDAPRAG